MKESLLETLVCPSCKGDLIIHTCKNTTEIEEGTLHCVCGRYYPIVSSIPRFVEDDAYVKSFSMEWNIHPKTQLDNSSSDVSEKDFTRKTGLSNEDVEGKLVLDVGCGMGRFMDVIEKWGGEVVGVDLSCAVNSA